MTGIEVDPSLDETPEAQTEPCHCQSYLRATERAALAAARWLGRADQEAAEEAAAVGHARDARHAADPRPRRLRRGRRLERARARRHDRRRRAEVDLALDPLEGRGVVARGGNGAMSMIAVGDTGS